MKRLQSKDHGTGAYQIKKLLCSDVKIYILNNRYDRLAFSYPDQLYKKTVIILVTVHNNLFVKL